MSDIDYLQWYRRYASIVDDWDAFERSLTLPLSTCIRTNPIKTTPDQLALFLHSDGVKLKSISGISGGFQIQNGLENPGRHWAFWAGLYSVMETVSMLPVSLLDPQPHERVLDLCAAPGSKTIQIGWAMKNTGTLIANDRDQGRIQALRQGLLRMGLMNVSTTVYDGVNYPKDAGYFDRILVDVPCSCEGTLRKNREVAYRLDNGKVRALARIQTLLLEKAFQLCRVGGRIVYSTCTFAPEENEMVVASVLKKYGPEQLTLVPAQISEFQTSPGLQEWEGKAFDPSLRHTIRIWPHHNDTGGFFIAVLEKKEEQGSPITKNRKLTATQSVKRPDQISRKTDHITDWLKLISARFAIHESEWDNYQFFSTKKERIAITAKDHTVPICPEVNKTGLPFMRANSLYPKLSTPIAQLMGLRLQHHYVTLSREQIELYMRRELITLHPEQMVHVSETGYVIVRYNEIVLGVGFIKKPGNDPPQLMESLFPKAWFYSTFTD